MMRSPRLPGLAGRILSLLLPRSGREHALGDLREEFARRHEAGRGPARRWLWRQVRLGLAYRLHSARPLPRKRSAGLGHRVDALLQDVRYAARVLRRSPGFVLVASLTLALGIGANTMIYALVDGILLRGLPFEDAERLVLLRNSYADGRPDIWLVSFPDYEDYRDGVDAFAQLAAWQEVQPALASADGQAAQRLHAVDATWNLLPMLGAEPMLGRPLQPDDDTADAPVRTALLSHALWRSRFGGDPAVLGRTIRLDDLPYVIVGVLPAGFTGVSGGFVLPSVRVDIWLPYRASFSGGSVSLRGLTNVNVLGKLAPDATLQQARAQVEAVSRNLDERFPEDRNNIAGRLLAAQDKAVETVRRPLLLTFSAVSLLLLIACTNVASLLLGRAATRRREVAMRTALGAGRLRLLRQLVAESVMLAALGGGIGAAGAALGLRLLKATEALQIARLDDISIDARVLLFLFAVALAAALAFGVGPAVFATRESPAAVLRQSGPGLEAPRSLACRGLVVAEVALAVLLLVGAGLLWRSLQRVVAIDPGFEPDGVLTARVQLPMPFVSDQWPQAVEFFERFENQARSLPGVVSVASAYQLPTDTGWNNGFEFAASGPGTKLRQLADGDIANARFRPVTPGYFETAGIRLLRGRTLSDADSARAPGVVVVNERFVRQYFVPGADPIGTRLSYGNWWTGGAPEYEIVGVVQDVLFSGRARDSYPATYFAHAQQPVREMAILVRTASDPMQLAAPLRQLLSDLDPGLPLDDVALLRDQLGQADAGRRSLAGMLIGFALVALALAGIGVYGVMAFAVARRTRELGIRVALGAQRGQVRRMVLLSGLRLTAAGLALGLTGAYLLGGVIASLLYEVEPTDVPTFASAAAFLGAIALLASWLPALRATHVDPMRSLRAE